MISYTILEKFKKLKIFFLICIFPGNNSNITNVLYTVLFDTQSNNSSCFLAINQCLRHNPAPKYRYKNKFFLLFHNNHEYRCFSNKFFHKTLLPDFLNASTMTYTIDYMFCRLFFLFVDAQFRKCNTLARSPKAAQK